VPRPVVPARRGASFALAGRGGAALLAVEAVAVLVTLAATWGAPASRADDDPVTAAAKRVLDGGDPAARAAAVRRLAPLRDAAAVSQVIAALSDPHPYVRRAAGGVLGIAIAPEVRSRVLRDAPTWKDVLARREAASVFGLWLDGDGRAGLLRLAADKDAGVRAAAVRRLGDDADAAALSAVASALADPDGLVRATAYDAMAHRLTEPARGRGTSSSSPAIPVDWIKGVADRDARVRLSALEGSAAVASKGSPTRAAEARETAMVAVLHGLDDAVWSVRLAAAGLAGTLRDRRMLAPLVTRLHDERRRVVDEAGRSLTRLTGIPFDADPAPWEAWLRGDGASFDPGAVEPKVAFQPKGKAEPPTASGTTVAPARLLDLPITSSHVAFVLDASGSMKEPMSAPERPPGKPRDPKPRSPPSGGASGGGSGGGNGSDAGRPSASAGTSPPAGGLTRWDRLRIELDAALGDLGEKAEVNVVLFSDEAKALFPASVRVSPASRSRVHDALAGHAPAGRTALYDGIALALSDPEVDTVVVLSDGAPSAGQWFTKSDLRREVARANRWRKARIDVVAIGADEVAKRWRSLLEEIAEESGGTMLER
jgi:HEAT repeat protein